MPWQSKIFSFNQQLKSGEKGENLFLKYYKNLNPRLGESNKIDIIINKGEPLELKTDSYLMSKTENYAMEQYGNLKNKTPGGPFRAYNDNIKYFVYLYIKDLTFFWFNTKTLRNYLLKNISSFKIKIIRNVSWEGSIFLVPREDIKHLVIREDCFL